MCGIAGFCLNKNEHFDARDVSMALLEQIIARGEDATGAAWVQASATKGERPKIAVSKAPVPAYDFDPYLKSMPKHAGRVILHTRYATKGTPDNNLNNHPIVAGRVVGVHNGVLSNDDAIFDYLDAERKAQVDSEAAFALLNVSKYPPANVLQSLQGRAALAWLDGRDKRDLHLARVSGSPLAIGSTPKGSLFFASTMNLLVAACADAKVPLKWVEEIDEMTYMRIRNGEIFDLQTIGESLKEIA
jgi:glucosamine 6-phosphate synthetase-like amidotransferase/phosphosugar isomerase protein